MRGGVAVLFRKGLDLKVRIAFLQPQGKMLVLNVDDSKGVAFRLVAFYPSKGQGSHISSDVWRFSL